MWCQIPDPVCGQSYQPVSRTLADDLNKSLAAWIDSTVISERVVDPSRSSVAKDSPPPTLYRIWVQSHETGHSVSYG